MWIQPIRSVTLDCHKCLFKPFILRSFLIGRNLKGVRVANWHRELGYSMRGGGESQLQPAAKTLFLWNPVLIEAHCSPAFVWLPPNPLIWSWIHEKDAHNQQQNQTEQRGWYKMPRATVNTRISCVQPLIGRQSWIFYNTESQNTMSQCIPWANR